MASNRKGGKGSRARRKEARKKAKQQRKLQYAALAGKPNTRKRAGRGFGSSKLPGHPHKEPCGNGACKLCSSGPHNDPWQSEPGSCLYGKRWSSSKFRN